MKNLHFVNCTFGQSFKLSQFFFLLVQIYQLMTSEENIGSFTILFDSVICILCLFSSRFTHLLNFENLQHQKGRKGVSS